MDRTNKKKRNQTVQFLFTMLLFLILTICAVVTVTFGTRVYRNIDSRMNENFSSTTSLSYISNKIKQSDERNAISVETIQNTKVLKIEQEIEGNKYVTRIYYFKGKLKELFCSNDYIFDLEDGLDIMDSEGINFRLYKEKLLIVETAGENGDSIHLALRSEG